MKQNRVSLHTYRNKHSQMLTTAQNGGPSKERVSLLEICLLYNSGKKRLGLLMCDISEEVGLQKEKLIRIP